MGYAARRVFEEGLIRRKPAGGFTLIRGTALLNAWRAYQGGLVTLLDLRVWLACFELVARRCGATRGSPRRYMAREVMALTGCKNERSFNRSIGRLRRIGLLQWSESEVAVGHVVSQVDGHTPAEWSERLRTVPNHARQIPVPRRMIRLLARDGTKVMIATVFGHLLRCLYYRSGCCRPSGLCKASWIARVFDVDVRNVKAARKALVDRSILTVEQRPQWFLNRYGPAVTVNLEWAVDEAGAGRGSSPPSRPNGRGLPPPGTNKKLLRIKNQKPRPARAGVSTRAQHATQANLRHVEQADLVDPGRLAMLYEQARVAGLVNGSEADRLKFVAMAEHARRVGTRNSAGLFVTAVRRGRWALLTLADEDAGRRRLACCRSGEAVQTPGRAAKAPAAVKGILPGLMNRLELLQQQAVR